MGKMFSYLFYFVNSFYAYDAICKDAAAINYITVRCERGLFLTILCHTILLIKQ